MAEFISASKLWHGLLSSLDNLRIIVWIACSMAELWIKMLKSTSSTVWMHSTVLKANSIQWNLRIKDKLVHRPMSAIRLYWGFLPKILYFAFLSIAYPFL